MNTLSRLARAGTAVAVAALLVFSGSGAAQAATVIDNTAQESSTLGELGAVGYGTPTYGQVITVPAGENTLNNFSFRMSGSDQTVFRGQVYAWGGSHPTGSPLFTSAPRTLVGDYAAYETVSFATGGVALTPGGRYVLAVTTLLDTSTGSMSWATAPSGSYAEGFGTWHNAGTVEGMETQNWDGGSDETGRGYDIDWVFTADFSASPVVSALVPANGPNGTSVTITGQLFTGATEVTFGGVAATNFIVDSATQITAVAPAGANGSVDVAVATPSGASSASAASAFTYTNPTLSALEPATGTANGGTAVTITGENLSAASAVSFGAVPATSFTVVSATRIDAVAPAQAAGQVDVVVTTPSGATAVGDASAFDYVASPLVSSISPASGVLDGGESVTITGTDFTGTTAVDFGDVAATSFTVDSGTQIIAVVPAQVAGTVDVIVTTPYGVSLAGDSSEYRYVAAPVVTGLSFGDSATSGGRTLTITGTDLGTAGAVDFGDVAATDITVVSDTEITAVVPAQDAGTVDVVVTTAYGVSTPGAESSFRYVAAPTVTALSARSGSTVGGYAVTITGTDFTGATAVAFGQVAAARFTVVSDTEISAIVAAAPAGVADVVVTTPFGVSAVTAAAEFTLVAPASVPAAIVEALAFTGAETTGVLAGGLALLLAGLGAFVVSRRRA